VAVALAGVIAFSGGRALAVNVSCGDTITTDTTLHKDLVDCPNNGLIIGADDATLDLNGHTIDGDGTPAAGCDPNTEFCDVGVLSDGHDGVTVVHGSVRQFDAGVVVGEAHHNRVLGISSSRNLSFGMVVFASVRSVVRNGSFSRNIPPEGDGIGVFDSDHLRILNNRIRRNPGPGIHVFHSTENLIKGNRLSRCGGVAIPVQGSDHNRVLRNRIRCGVAIIVGWGKRNVIAGNRIRKVELDAIGINKGNGNLIARNHIFGPGGSGVYLGHPRIGGHDNLVRRNFVRASGKDAYLVRSEDRHSRLTRNVAVGAGDDGFDVESRSTKLTRNRAVRNADLGIEAVHGVNDGGGNIAHHNGDPRQCTNVACR
jgi:parallel beta-helix repeat protein